MSLPTIGSWGGKVTCLALTLDSDMFGLIRYTRKPECHVYPVFTYDIDRR